MSLEVTQAADTRDVFRHLRQEARLNQQALAKAAGITRETYNRWERGRASLREQRVVKMAGLLCTHLSSDLDRKELIEALVNNVPMSRIIALKMPLLEDLSLIEQVEEEISRLTTYSSTS